MANASGADAEIHHVARREFHVGAFRAEPSLRFGEHPRAQIEPQREPCTGTPPERDPQIAGTASQVEHNRILHRALGPFDYKPLFPLAVHAKREKVGETVVAGRDDVEHRPHVLAL